ncbi:hypothetical protein ScalyP_jg8261 [Parmales sp. scaly parma]|nr:hypothetical protein ScalyP_jg8261 [Parmales sp. scaly parma]
MMNQFFNQFLSEAVATEAVAIVAKNRDIRGRAKHSSVVARKKLSIAAKKRQEQKEMRDQELQERRDKEAAIREVAARDIRGGVKQHSSVVARKREELATRKRERDQAQKEFRDKEAKEKQEQKERREQVAAKDRQEQQEMRDKEAAKENQELAKIAAEIEMERLNTEARRIATETKTKAKKLKSKWLRFGYSLSKKESIREIWVFALEFHELERREQVAAKSKWLRFGYSLNKKESIRETWVFALEFHELCLSRRPTSPPEVIIFRYVSKWLTSRKTKKFLKKEFVGYLTYYVNQRLGESNQDVFRGYETSMDKIENTEKITPCAIKKIRASEVASVGELAVMKKALGVKCVNVLELHAVVTTDEYIFLAVELCEGCLGRDDFFDTFKLSISERLELCRQIVVGVNHLHKVGVFHRDIKPGNVLFKQDEGSLVLKIADMGISKVASEKTLQTVTNASAGTPLYMPSELLNDVEDQGGKVTKERFVAHDMFSLGVLLHYVLTSGEHPISNPNITPSTSNPFLYSYHKSISFVGVPTPSPHTNGTIATLFFAHPRSRGVTIIFSHGNAEDLGTCAPNLLELSRVLCVNVVGYDYRGYGQSAFCNNTNISESSVDEDLQSVFAHVVLNKKISPSKIFLYGRSLGSSPSTKLASILTSTARKKRRSGDLFLEVENVVLKQLFERIRGQPQPKANLLCGLVLQSAMKSCVKTKVDLSFLGNNENSINSSKSKLDCFETQSYIGSVECPIFIVHGTSDRIVPSSHATALHKLATGARDARWSLNEKMEILNQNESSIMDWLVESKAKRKADADMDLPAAKSLSTATATPDKSTLAPIELYLVKNSGHNNVEKSAGLELSRRLRGFLISAIQYSPQTHQAPLLSSP